MLASLLVDTVQSVLDAAQEERCEIRLMDCLTHSETTFRLGNDAAMIGPLVNYLHRTIRAIGVVRSGVRHPRLRGPGRSDQQRPVSRQPRNQFGPRTGDSDIVSRNWWPSGCAPHPFCDRVIDVQAKFTREEATFVVRDQGPGFDPDIPARSRPIRRIWRKPAAAACC